MTDFYNRWFSAAQTCLIRTRVEGLFRSSPTRFWLQRTTQLELGTRRNTLGSQYANDYVYFSTPAFGRCKDAVEGPDMQRVLYRESAVLLSLVVGFRCKVPVTVLCKREREEEEGERG